MNIDNTVAFEDTAVAFAAKSDKALKKKYLIFASMNSNWLVKTGTSMMKTALKLRLPVTGIIKHTIFEQFCGGETIADSEDTIKQLAQFNIKTILDYSVEGEGTEKSYEHTCAEVLRTIERAKGSADIPFSVFKVTGIGSTEVMEKVQLQKDSLSDKDIAAFQKIRERVDKICKSAHDNDVSIFIDGEESWIQDTIDMLTYEMMEKYNKDKAIVYNTYQMYRKDMLLKLKTAFQHATAKQYQLGAKLVRGAYMEKERARAKEFGYPDPIQINKAASDEDYNRALLFCMNNKQRIALCSGSHNEYSNYYLTVLMDKHGLKRDDERVYFAQLYGMSDNISFTLAKAGYNVVKYVPYGPVAAVMPYLFRRADENTSIAGQSGREFNLIQKEIDRRRKLKRAS